jgi:hypothetical protein
MVFGKYPAYDSFNIVDTKSKKGLKSIKLKTLGCNST